MTLLRNKVTVTSKGNGFNYRDHAENLKQMLGKSDPSEEELVKGVVKSIDQFTANLLKSRLIRTDLVVPTVFKACVDFCQEEYVENIPTSFIGIRITRKNLDSTVGVIQKSWNKSEEFASKVVREACKRWSDVVLDENKQNV